MIDWTRSMQQTYEFYTVDPDSWGDKEKITTIESCSITRDATVDTLGSASFNCTGILDEQYIRVYLSVKQGEETDRVCLGTFLTQTPTDKFDGKRRAISLDGYTPLIELKQDNPTLGYTVRKNALTVISVAPTLRNGSVANTDDTWFTFISDLIANANFSFGLEPEGNVIFEPYTDLASMRPKWIFDDSNSSILLPEITNERDLFNVPNVVEVVYSTDNGILTSVAINDDPESITSTVSRGRIVRHRETSPSISENMTGANAQAYLDAYAEKLLRNLSNVEHELTYSHGYCPVRLGDCVLLNYERAGLVNVRAKVIRQEIDCETGCTVAETAIYTTQLWR